MKKIINNEYLILASRLVLGYFFIFAAVGKIAEPDHFAKEIANYQIFPYWGLNIAALILPWLELISGTMLIFGLKLKANASIIGVLLTIFIVAVFSAMMRGLNINCGCFSNKIVIVGWNKILENLGLLVLSILIFITKSKKFSFQDKNEVSI